MARSDWIAAGFELIAAEGAASLTIDRLAARVQRTKGAFYHHFGGLPGYKAALLEAFEAEYTERFIDAVEAEPGLAPREQLERLLSLVLEGEPRAALTTQLRAWALRDPDVLRSQERVDRRRLDYLSGVCREATGDASAADDLARLLYAILVGAWHVVPPLDAAQLRRLYTRALDLVVARPDHGGGG